MFSRTQHVVQRWQLISRFAVLAAALFVTAVGATQVTATRLYQWRDPTTGTLQLAGRPPAWYRGEQPGPRVRVYQAGRLLDDTARTVAPTARSALRVAAFGDAAPAGPRDAPGPVANSPAINAATSGTPATTTKIAEFKALLDAWDREQSAAATHQIDSSASAPEPPPPTR
ncbi:MAG: hypothetical protein HYX63_20740 [Gammaproteobacteria bacterium]|nr:hypothetical protein [Gammaproteobacteria bacterium]